MSVSGPFRPAFPHRSSRHLYAEDSRYSRAELVISARVHIIVIITVYDRDTQTEIHVNANTAEPVKLASQKK